MWINSLFFFIIFVFELLVSIQFCLIDTKTWLVIKKFYFFLLGLAGKFIVISRTFIWEVFYPST